MFYLLYTKLEECRLFAINIPLVILGLFYYFYFAVHIFNILRDYVAPNILLSYIIGKLFIKLN